MASRYFHDPIPVVVSGQRELDYTIVGSFEEAIPVARSHGMAKLLVCANSRRKVEALAAEARTIVPPRLVVAHHGSLSRREREEAEEFMRSTRYGVCVATMTLEIGIDIGDIDGVILAEPPPSISALLQRVGRGNRRSNVTTAIAICASEDEHAVTVAMFEAARQGQLETLPYEPDLSVVVQQLFSMLYAQPTGLTSDELRQVFTNFCPPTDLEEILAHLGRRSFLESRPSRWYASSTVMDMGERGFIHSNVPNQTALRVVDIHSHRVIGQVHEAVDEVFALAGRAWRVVEIKGDSVYVRQVPGRAPAPAFRPHHARGAFARYLPDRLRKADNSEYGG